MPGGNSLYLQFDFEMFEKCKARTGDWLVVIRGQRRRLELRDHQGSSAGTGQALGLNLAGHLGPQDHRGLRDGVRGLGVLSYSREDYYKEKYLLSSPDSPSQCLTGYR